MHNTGSIKLTDFYVRRVKRILPALITTLFLSFLFASLIFSPNHLHTIAGSMLSAIFGMSNFYFWFEADYFDTSTKLKPFLHTWSLGIEEQFYLFWSIIIFLIYKFRAKNIILLITITIFAVSLFFNYIFVDDKDSFIHNFILKATDLIANEKSTLFYLLPFRIYEFAIGSMLVFVYTFKINNKLLNDFLFIIGLLLIIYSVSQYNSSIVFPYFYALIPTIGAALVIYSGENSRINIILNNRIMIYIGLISYSLYLVHWPVISFYNYLLEEQDLEIFNQLSIIFISFFFSYLIYNFVETPFRKKVSRIGFLFILFIFILTIILGLHAYKNKGWEWRVNTTIVDIEKVENSEVYHKQFYGGNPGYFDYKAYDESKFADIVLLGDSHSAHYAYGLHEILYKKFNKNIYVGGFSCLHLPNITRIDYVSLCIEYTNKMLEYIKDLPETSIIIISNSWNGQISNARYFDKENNIIDKKLLITDIVREIINLSNITKAKLVVIGNVPTAGLNLYDIFTRPRPLMFNNFNPIDYLYREKDSALVSINRELKRFSEETGKFTFIDPFEILCNDNKCRNIDHNNRLIYSDNAHLSKYGSYFIIDSIQNELLELLNK